jgi:holo-[acyl-carrier protein] synthase
MILQSGIHSARIELENLLGSRRTLMEIVGIGTDIVECVRIARMIEEHGELFLTRVYTAWEIRWCRERKHSTEHFAGHWAAKEAVLKCLGAAGRRALSWTDMEVRTVGNGQPQLHAGGAAKERIQELRIGNILLSIAHCRAYATAYAIAVRAAPPAEPQTG